MSAAALFDFVLNFCSTVMFSVGIAWAFFGTGPRIGSLKENSFMEFTVRASCPILLFVGVPFRCEESS